MTDDPAAPRPDPPPASAGAPPGSPGADDAQQSPPHDAVGAYVLDALPEEERRDFEAHLATCADCQRAVAELAPVVALLPRLFELAPEPGAAGGAEAIAQQAGHPDPAPDLRERILAALPRDATAEDQRPDAAPVATAEAAPPTEPVSIAAPIPTVPGSPPRRTAVAERDRPRGRIRPGVATPGAGSPTPLRTAPRFNVGTGWLAAAVLVLVAAGAVVWALALQGELSDQRDELAAQRATIEEQAAEIEEIRRRANATAFALNPTADGPSGASGNLLYSLRDQFGVLYVRGLAPLPPGQDYQLWFLEDGTAQPGATFEVDAQGNGSLPLTTDVQTFDGVGITAEPDGGSREPTSAVLLAGTVGGAAG